MNPSLPLPLPTNRRILVVDDNAAIHEDFREILAPTPTNHAGVDAAAALLFDQAPVRTEAGFELDFAHQGQAALEKVRAARAEGRPYALAFVDMQMPPGWDGLTTISHLWEADAALQTVICTAYSDRSWEEIRATLTTRERWLVLKKPFDKIEVLQLAHALTEKWNLGALAALKVDKLEQLVQARTLDLQNAHRVKNEFLANASHELLTPMNGICGVLEFLATTPLTDEQSEFLQEARKCGRNLLHLISQVLDFNRAEAGQIPAEPVSFAPARLLQELVEQHAEAAAAQGLQWQVDTARLTPERWLAPQAILRKALAPLVENAVKFTTSGTITLTVEPHDQGLAFTITNPGTGLTPAQLEWIQIPFAQVDGGISRRHAGIGLGLPLARQLVQVMGGALTLSSQPQHGVTAHFFVKARATGAGNIAA